MDFVGERLVEDRRLSMNASWWLVRIFSDMPLILPGSNDSFDQPIPPLCEAGEFGCIWATCT